MREVMMVDRNWRAMEGRWFNGGYDEVGIDVKMERIGNDPRVLGTDRTALKQGTSGQELKIQRDQSGIVAPRVGHRPRSGHRGVPRRERNARFSDGRGAPAPGRTFLEGLARGGRHERAEHDHRAVGNVRIGLVGRQHPVDQVGAVAAAARR